MPSLSCPRLAQSTARRHRSVPTTTLRVLTFLRHGKQQPILQAIHQQADRTLARKPAPRRIRTRRGRYRIDASRHGECSGLHEGEGDHVDVATRNAKPKARSTQETFETVALRPARSLRLDRSGWLAFDWTGAARKRRGRAVAAPTRTERWMVIVETGCALEDDWLDGRGTWVD